MADEQNTHTVYGVGDNGEAEMVEVSLNKNVEINGFLYKAKFNHTVSQEIADQMGDAVKDVKPARRTGH